MNHCARVAGHCGRCEGELPFDFTMAFQPIVDLGEARVVSFEALVRGLQGESAWSILSQVTDEMRYRFDQACRVRAIELASELGMRETLSINFLPNAVYEPQACIQATLEVSKRVGWPTDRIVFEITETEKVEDRQHLRSIIDAYHAMGFTTALDDFGNGYANLDLLTDLMPDRLKIDRELVMGCDGDCRRQALLRAVKGLADELDIALIAEGVETRAEALWLGRLGIVRQQGFYFARPAVESLGEDLGPMLVSLREALASGSESRTLIAEAADIDHLAHHDELTGTLNRRAGLARLEEERERSERYETPLSIAMYDLDHFKQINATHGHAVGDEVLREVTDLVQAALRETDLVVRLGGEEFLVIMPGVENVGAHQAMERVRGTLANAPLTPRQLTMTLSAGAIEYQGEHPDRLLELADKALYRAKAAGRNQVAMSE